MDTIELNATDDGSSVATHPGQLVRVSLPELPSTGYSWRVLPGAQVVGDDFVLESAIGVGGGGLRIFTFLAGPEPQELRFELVRDWQPESPERTFRCQILPT